MKTGTPSGPSTCGLASIHEAGLGFPPHRLITHKEGGKYSVQVHCRRNCLQKLYFNVWILSYSGCTLSSEQAKKPHWVDNLAAFHVGWPLRGLPWLSTQESVLSWLLWLMAIHMQLLENVLTLNQIILQKQKCVYNFLFYLIPSLLYLSVRWQNGVLLIIWKLTSTPSHSCWMTVKIRCKLFGLT